MPFCLANAAICVVGSDPIDSRQTNGVRGSDSAQVTSRSKICISLYSGPRDSVNLIYLFENLYFYIYASRSGHSCGYGTHIH